MNDITLLLEDTITFKTVPFLVQVEEREMFYNKDKDEVRGMNIGGNPCGMGRTPRGWRVVKARVANIRPDYPYRIDKRWPENVSKHFRESELLEKPIQDTVFFIFPQTKWVEREPERSAKELAEDVVETMKSAYHNRQTVETLN
jgi:hypothetical protein